MPDDNTKLIKKKRQTSRLFQNLNVSQEKGSYYFFKGLLIIAIFGCVASGAPRQGFYGIIFVSIGILVALFPPVFITPKWLNIGLVLFLISLASSLLPRSFSGSQSWRVDLESLGLETGNLISPHPAATVECIIIIGIIVMLGVCTLGHRVSRERFLKITSLFVIALTLLVVISMLFKQNKWDWSWDPNNEFGFFANRNHMATLMVIGSLVGVGSLFIYLKKRIWSGSLLMLIATGIICWGILGYSLSRAGFILFVFFQTTWFLFICKRHLNYKLVTSFLVLFSLAVALFISSDTALENRLEKFLSGSVEKSKYINHDTKSNYNSVLGSRKYIHNDTYRMIRSEPWSGTGLGTYEFIFPFYKAESIDVSYAVSNSYVLHPESNWLDLASQAGTLSVILIIICVLPLLVLIFLRNQKSRYRVLTLSCLFSFFCIMIHGLVDVPSQKIGIVLSVILLIGISQKGNHSNDKTCKPFITLSFQILAISTFSLGLILIHSQWMSSKSIFFSGINTQINKIQNLYQLSVKASEEKDHLNQKAHILSAIDLAESAIQRTPLNQDLHFICGKLYSFLDGNDDKTKLHFDIESALDPTWVNLTLRQSKVWLFINTKETRKLWIEALNRSKKFSDKSLISTWNQVIDQAKQNPILIRDTYKIILDENESSYIKKWMNFAGDQNVNNEIPKIIKNNFLSHDTIDDILIHWKRVSPKGYQEYYESHSKK